MMKAFFSNHWSTDGLLIKRCWATGRPLEKKITLDPYVTPATQTNPRFKKKQTYIY